MRVRPFKSSLITTSFSYLLRYHSHHTGNVCDSTNHGSLDHVTLAEFISTSLVDHRVLFCSSCYYHPGSNTYNRPVFLIPSLISLFFFEKSIFCVPQNSRPVYVHSDMSPLIVPSTKHSVTVKEKRLLLFNIHRLVRAANFGPGILRSGERTSRLIICRDDQDFCLVVRLGLSPALSLQEQRHMQAI